jgi:hypothetical protein
MMRKDVFLLILLFILTAAGCMTTNTLKDGPNPIEIHDIAQIYAAAIREIHSNARSSTLVYVVTTTEDLAIFDGPIDPPEKLTTDLQVAITTELADEQYELIWIEAFEDAPTSPINPETGDGWKIAEGEGMIITLGNIHPQEDGSVQLSFFMSCADVCGIGMNLVLNQEYGNWHVSGSVGPVIAS